MVARATQIHDTAKMLKKGHFFEVFFFCSVLFCSYGTYRTYSTDREDVGLEFIVP